MLAKELISKIRHIELRARHLVTDTLSGDYASAFRGQGMEFDEVREYVPGDDVRAIDWNVTARTGVPFIKVYREEREQTLMLLIDVSPSQDFGTREQTKNEKTAELAAVLAFCATRNNDKVGLIVFSDHIEKYIPPKKGRAHVWNIIKTVLGHKGQGKKTDLDGALGFLLTVHKRKSLCFLISDFCAEPAQYQDKLARAARRHDLVCVRVYDLLEDQLPAAAGVVQMRDSETGETCTVDTGSKAFQSYFVSLVKQEREELESYFRRKGIDFLRLATNDHLVAAIEGMLRRREQRRRR